MKGLVGNTKSDSLHVEDFSNSFKSPSFPKRARSGKIPTVSAMVELCWGCIDHKSISKNPILKRAEAGGK